MSAATLALDLGTQTGFALLAVLSLHHGDRRFDHVGIKSAAKPAIGSNDYKANVLHRTLLPVHRFRISFQVGEDVAEHFIQLVSVGTHVLNGLLSLPQFSGRYHFHGFSDLLRIVDRCDAFAYLF